MREVVIFLLLCFFGCAYSEIETRDQQPSTRIDLDSKCSKEFREKLYKHIFKFDPERNKIDPPITVALCADFNDWKPIPMVREKDSTYILEVELPAGFVNYTFLVSGSCRDVFNDPEIETLNFFGTSYNSAVIIGPDPRKFLPPSPGKINQEAIKFCKNSIEDLDVVSSSILKLNVTTQANDVTELKVWYKEKKDKKWNDSLFHKIRTFINLDHYACEVFTSNNKDIDYFIQAINSSSSLYLASGGFYSSFEEAANACYGVEMEPSFITPDWAKEAIWYQIYPDRFRASPMDKETLEKWNTKLFSDVQKMSEEERNVLEMKRIGGNLAGVQESLVYLRKLGVNALYFNPILKAFSAHKYDTIDFRHIDDDFAIKDSLQKIKGETEDPSTWQFSESDQKFIEFVREAHRQGFKIIFDITLHSISAFSDFFIDVLLKREKSKYFSWFIINDWNNPNVDSLKDRKIMIKQIQEKRPEVLTSSVFVDFAYWGGNLGSPLFRKEASGDLTNGPKQYLFEITKRWLAPRGNPLDGVDGFRLDSYKSLSPIFWKEWRKLVKAIKPEALIIGELWRDTIPFLEGDQLDGTVHIEFARAVHDCFVKDPSDALTFSQFDLQLHQFTEEQPLQASFVEMNLLDNHDTDRLITMFANPHLTFDKLTRNTQLNLEKEKYVYREPLEKDWTRFKQVIAFQMTFLGAPTIYYGDEVGMWGAAYPFNRMPMRWEGLQPYEYEPKQVNQEIFHYYQRLLAVRRGLPALSQGLWETVLVDDVNAIYVFRRYLPTSSVYVVLNRSDKKHSVSFDVNPHDASHDFIDFMDNNNVSVDLEGMDKVDGRPSLKIAEKPTLIYVENRHISVDVQPYGTSILGTFSRTPNEGPGQE